ncbi:hypothetical protein ACFQ1S_06355 [Kibdelosporangium lantanae]|uniref:Uncharacterized protein n=1 Tax=Kibdelosporangium lantanae TaxID=1497396 RepID=A0ABW3M6L8_9PSEU
MWDVASGTQQARLTGHDGLVNSVAVAPDGRWIASASNDGPTWVTPRIHRRPTSRARHHG